MDFTFGGTAIFCGIISAISLVIGGDNIGEGNKRILTFISGSLFGWAVLAAYKGLGV